VNLPHRRHSNLHNIPERPSILKKPLLLKTLFLLTTTLPAQTPTFTTDPIPTTTPSAHASTLVELKNGDILTAWFGGAAEGAKDVAIYSSRHTASGWSKPIELAREPDTPTWNPVLFHDAHHRLWLYYKFGPSYTWWSAARRFSDDEGRTWSPIVHLPAGIYGPIRDKPLLLADGSILSGTSVESYLSWSVWVERSTDNALSWTRIGPITLPSLLESPQFTPAKTSEPNPAHGLIQPAIVALGPLTAPATQHLRLYARATTDIGHICVSDSQDGGKSWSPARPIALPNPNSGIDAVRLQDGRIVLIYNNTPSGRTPLSLAVSKDGEHFTHILDLETTPGEYSYPALIQSRNGDLLATYTWNRKHIQFATIPLISIP